VTSDAHGYINLNMNFETVTSVMVTGRSCNNKLGTTELVVQCRKSQVTYGITGMKNLQKRKVRSKNKVR